MEDYSQTVPGKMGISEERFSEIRDFLISIEQQESISNALFGIINKFHMSHTEIALVAYLYGRYIEERQLIGIGEFLDKI